MTITVATSRPINISPTQKKIMWEDFLRTGNTTHSRFGSTLPFLISMCEQLNQPYELIAYPGTGYTLRKLKPLKGDKS